MKGHHMELSKPTTRHTSRRAFTIVELLIVIVVIAIIAVIIIVAYNGVRTRAIQSSLVSDARNGTSAIGVYQAQQGGLYPSTLAPITGLTTSDGNAYSYYYQSSDNTYCLGVKNAAANMSHSVLTSGKEPQSKGCLERDVIAWWPFNGNASDSSGDGHNGTITGAVPSTGQNGLANNAYFFNTTSGIVTSGTISLAPNSFTATAWIKANSSGDRKIVSVDSGNTHLMQILSGGQLRTCLETGSGTSCAAGGPDLANGAWRFVAVVGDATSVRGYVDANSTPVYTMTTPTPAVNGAVHIGRDPGNNYNFWGDIDDIRIYNKALSTTNIQALYDQGAQ